MAESKETKEMWVNWTRDALSTLMPSDLPDDPDDAEDLANELADVSTVYADAMLEEYQKRFDGGSGRGRRKKRRDREEEEGN